MNVGASYGYSGFRPSVRIGAGRTIVDRGGFRVDGRNTLYTEEDWSGTLSLGMPFESRPGVTWTLSASYDIDWFRLVKPPVFVLDPNQRVPSAGQRAALHGQHRERDADHEQELAQTSPHYRAPSWRTGLSNVTAWPLASVPTSEN